MELGWEGTERDTDATGGICGFKKTNMLMFVDAFSCVSTL